MHISTCWHNGPLHINWQALEMHHSLGACTRHTLMYTRAKTYQALSAEAERQA